jgi:hypothetical protein
VRARQLIGGALALGGVAWTLHLSSCGGGGGVCGDGVQDPGEECDDGNADQTDSCRNCMAYLAPRTTVIWSFDKYPDRGFTGDTCLDVGATKVRVATTGPTAVSQDVNCGDGQAVFQTLSAGAYTFAVTPLAGDGSALVKAPATAMAAAGGSATTVNVNVPWDSWVNTYTGTLLFRLTWAKASCSAATPPIKTQAMTLTASNGQVVTQVTDMGQKLDGTAGPCRESTDQFPQSALGLPFGPATFLVVGKDLAGIEQFRHTFDTFIGAGTNNPTLTYDLPGPDAMIDAGVADAPAD